MLGGNVGRDQREADEPPGQAAAGKEVGKSLCEREMLDIAKRLLAGRKDFDIDLPRLAETWRHGSVVRSWLLDLTANALQRSPDLDEFSGRVSDSGEGRWTTIAAIDEGVPTPVLTSALFERFESQGNGLFANRVLSAMRKEFGGHDEKKG